jgi:hypothetical protein
MGMVTIYLDQAKWIDLGRGAAGLGRSHYGMRRHTLPDSYVLCLTPQFFRLIERSFAPGRLDLIDPYTGSRLVWRRGGQGLEAQRDAKQIGHPTSLTREATQK